MSGPGADLDRGALARHLGGALDPALAVSVIHVYLDLIPQRAAVIERGRLRPDADATERMAHDLGAASALLGLDSMARAARALERDPEDEGLADRVIELLPGAAAALTLMATEIGQGSDRLGSLAS